MKNIIYTIYKDSVGINGNIISARFYLNETNGDFIDGYRIEKGIFKSRFIISKRKINVEAKSAPFVKGIENSGEDDCWNTDNLPSGGMLNEVFIGTFSNKKPIYVYNFSNFSSDRGSVNLQESGGTGSDTMNYGGAGSSNATQIKAAAGAITVNSITPLIKLKDVAKDIL